MHSKEEDLGKDCMEGEKGRLCERQELRTSEGDIKIGGISIEELKLDQCYNLAKWLSYYLFSFSFSFTK